MDNEPTNEASEQPSDAQAVGRTQQPFVLHFMDLWYSVVVTPGEYKADFSIYKIETIEERETDIPMFPRKGATSHPDPVENIADADVFAHGYVKWDGCSNWYFDEQDRVMLHGCERSHLTAIGEVLARCWDLAEKHCEHWLV